MKRILAVLMGMTLLVALSTAACAKAKVTVNAGLDLGGDFEVDETRYSDTDDTDTGLSLGAEVTSRQGQIEMGGGIELQMPRGVDDYSRYNPEFNFTSFYFVGKYYFQRKGPSGFLVGRIGFDTFDGNNAYTGYGQYSLDGGLYTAFGGGFRFGRGPIKSAVTMLYGINRGTIDYDYDYNYNHGYEQDVTYSKLSMIYGVTF